ncbi:MAG TPA: sigma-54 dependent transcriptional regulator [Vicinamibacterales bacterium]|nr:sigma-54 dependent transcriptional regulator [Vicinamibacterales bacterium]
MGSDGRRLKGTRAAEFVLAAAGPVSLDALVSWDIVRPTELWGWLHGGRDQGWIGEDAAAGPGHFVLLDVERQARVLDAAGPGDWAWLFGLADLIPTVLANGRRAADQRRQDVASALFHHMVLAASPESFPGGSHAWAGIVVECVRRFRFGSRLTPEILDRAIDASVACGNLEWQAILCGARGFESVRTARDMNRGGEYLERALEAARALDSRAVSFEVHLQVAFGQILVGQALAAVATFERLLGDLPQEILPLPPELQPLLDPVPETGLAILASTYGQVGQYGRALDLLHRLRSAGERVGRPHLVGLADCFLSGLHAGRREFEPARLYAESAVRYWTGDPTGPYFLWHASISLAWVRMIEGQLAAAADVLETGQRARVASGLMFFGGSALFEVLDRMDVEGVKPPAGLDVETELVRMLGWPDGYMRAVAHRIRARRLARGPLDEEVAARISAHHEQAVALLRESRACPSELARALADAAQWAECRGRQPEAERLHDESRRVFASIDLAPASGNVLELATALLELGRLGVNAAAGDTGWGDLAARLCAVLGVERCAIVERGAEAPLVVASRGGGPAWVEAVRSLLAARPPEEVETGAPLLDDGPRGTGQLLVVPFGSTRLPKSGWAVFENRYSRPLVSASDRRLLDVLGAQLGVLAENLSIWRDLIEARRRLEQENRYYRQAPSLPSAGGRIVGESPALRQTLELVGRVAPTVTSVLIEGETGVGKELIAREIHRLSPRRPGPFIAVHIASFAPGLVASSLFGHERGAFTGATEQARGRFELADGGTLFLDEVGELTLEDQVRLLRVLQEGTFERVGGTRPLHSDFRLVAATNRDLRSSVARGEFREDLFFRLSAFPIVVPPLRERREEIPTLALYFMERANRTLARAFQGIGEADMARLVAYRWPGNVRELEHLIERAAILSEPPRLKIPPLQDETGDGGAPEASLGTLEEAERQYFRRLIARTAGRVSGPSGAAAIAGLRPSTFTWHVEKLGLRADLQRARAARG